MLFALAARATQITRGEELPDVVRARTVVMLRDVRQETEPRYYDPAFHGLDLGASADVAKARIAKAGSIGEASGAIAQVVLELDESHTFFVPPAQTVRVDDGWDVGIVGDDCYVLRVTPGSDAARQGIAPGDRVTAVNGFRPTRVSLWQLKYLFNLLRPQPGLHVELVIPAGERARARRRREGVDAQRGPPPYRQN